ncbi:MAG: ABC transporter ATP-binding protein, partial [Treponema sp.]|nr:ABC transporter ATP-binding protein [Treponema sp.]
MSDRRDSRGERQGPGLGGPGRFAMMGAKAKDFKGTMRRLMGYLRPYRGAIVFVWILAALSTAFTIAGPSIMGRVTDEIVSGLTGGPEGTSTVNFNRIDSILLRLLGLYLISSLCGWLQGYVMAGVTVKAVYQMRDDIGKKIHRLPFSFFDGVTHGEVLSRLTNDVDTVGQSLNMSITQIITSLTSALGILAIMISVNPILTLISIGFLSLSFIFITLIVRKSQKLFREQQRSLGKVNGHIEEMFSSHVAVKAFSGEAGSVTTFDGLNKTLYHAAWRSNFLSGLLMPITGFIGNLTYAVVCIIGGAFAVRGIMTIGGIQAFIQYIRSFNQPLTNIANISNILQQTAAAAERVFEFLAEKEEDPDCAVPLPPPSPWSRIV